MHDNRERMGVTIVGAGPSGLSLAIELGSRGIRCTVLERNPRIGYAPRAKTTNVRTRTHMRRWGIAGRLADEAPFGIDFPSDVHFVTRLGGQHLATIEDASNCAPRRNENYPEHGQWIPQYKLEQVLRAHAETLPSVSLRFNCEFVSATQDPNQVDVTFVDGTSEQQIRTDYLVGADGARSRVREAIGASMIGTFGLSRNYNIVFRAPGLAAAHPHSPGTMYWQLNHDSPGLVGPMDRHDVWFFMPTRVPEGFDLRGPDVAVFIRQSIGLDQPIEILSCEEWVASSVIADRYRDERIFLIGDACHLHPPFGGYGMNMGVSDGVDLGWKLAARLHGWGGPALLDSYAVERRQIHLDVLAEASANHGILANDLWHPDIDLPGGAGETARKTVERLIRQAKTREFHTLRTVLGGRYEHSPVIASDAVTEPQDDGSTYVPSSAPGALAPHYWIGDASIYDHLGDGFALLCRPDACPDAIASAVCEAARRSLKLRVLKIAKAGLDRYPADLTLVRPDQFVCWRGQAWDAGVLVLVTGWRTPPAEH